MTDDRLFLVHVRDCVSRVEEYVREGRDAFLSSALVQDAVLRNLQILSFWRFSLLTLLSPTLRQFTQRNVHLY